MNVKCVAELKLKVWLSLCDLYFGSDDKIKHQGCSYNLSTYLPINKGCHETGTKEGDLIFFHRCLHSTKKIPTYIRPFCLIPSQVGRCLGRYFGVIRKLIELNGKFPSNVVFDLLSKKNILTIDDFVSWIFISHKTCKILRHI